MAEGLAAASIFKEWWGKRGWWSRGGGSGCDDDLGDFKNTHSSNLAAPASFANNFIEETLPRRGYSREQKRGQMERDTAFEMAVSNIRFGQGITREVGMDLKDRGLRRVMVLTDAKLKEQSSVQTVLAAIEAELAGGK